jgi:hypothetical protein
MAAFQVIMNGRFWVITEARMSSIGGAENAAYSSYSPTSNLDRIGMSRKRAR